MFDTQPLLAVAVELTTSLASEDRHNHLLAAVRQLVPCDAACLLAAEGDELAPLATHGLAPDALGRLYARAEHPRLDLIARADGPLRFPPDTTLPDPFDGLVESDPSALAHVHACLGWPLRVEGELVGLLTADALAPAAFDDLDPQLLSWIGALAGAALRTSRLIEVLRRREARLGDVASDLMRTAEQARGAVLLGTSSAMQRLRDEIEVVARSDLTVLVTGETGVGKELVARAVHARSSRRDAPLIYVNCAALPAPVAESELFGHVRGAFTGADRHRAGKFEVASGGTLFLDEVGELPLSIQPKLLRVLQQGELQRLGADRPSSVDVRVVAATNRDLDAEVARGQFRADLFHRLAVYPLRVPPLRDRAEDVLILAGHFCDQARLRLGTGPVRLTPPARERLRAYAWPGNARELENVLFRLILRTAAGAPRSSPVVIDEAGVAATLGGSAPPGSDAEGDCEAPPGRSGEPASLSDQVDAFKRERIQQALDTSGGRWALAARKLGMHRSNLHHLAKRLGMR